MIKLEEQLLELKKKLIELEEDKSYFNKFNIFQTLRITNTEIRHSNVLSWLMSPNENHNLKGYFLRHLLADINDLGEYQLDLVNVDFESFEIRREWNDIDVLALSRKNKILLVIENKIWSNESNNQLEKYKRIAESEFTEFEKIFVYLTPYGDLSSDPDVWISYDYEKILAHLDKLIEFHSKSLDSEVLIFLNHYATNLRRNIVGDKRLQDLCLDIYAAHREAFDFILDNLPNQKSIYHSILIDYLEYRNDIIMDDSSKTLIRFITKNLENVIPISHAGWTRSGRIFLFEIENSDLHLKLKTVVGPSVSDERDLLLLYMNSCHQKDLFKDINKQIVNPNKVKNRKWSHVNGELILDKTSYDVRNESVLKEIIYERMDELFESYIKEVSEYLLNFEL